MRSLSIVSAGNFFDGCIYYLYSRDDILLDPATLGGVVGEVSGLDQDLTVLELIKVLLDKLEGVLIRHVGGRVGQHPCAGSLRSRHCV